MNQVTFRAEAHEYFDEKGIQRPSCSELLSHFGLSDFSKVDSRVLERACSFGTVVHQTCELHDLNDLGEFDPQVEPYLNSWIQFRKDYGVSGFDIIEKPMLSKIWGFAGTPDRVCGELLPDIKTGAESKSHRIQTALYKILVEENTNLKIKRRMCVYLDGKTYKVVEHKDNTDISIAKTIAQLYGWKKKEKLL